MCADEIDAQATGMDAQTKAAMKRTAERLRKFPADADWMVGILYTIKPAHPIFSKSYVVPKKVTAILEEKKPDLDAAFFAGLPLSKTKKRSTCTLGVPRLSKLEREQQRIAKLEEKFAMQQKKTAFQIQCSKDRIADEAQIAKLMEKVRQLENQGSALSRRQLSGSASAKLGTNSNQFVEQKQVQVNHKNINIGRSSSRSSPNLKQQAASQKNADGTEK